MYVIFATCRVQPERLDDFLAAMLVDARGANNDEPGCLRFDVAQDQHDPTRICLYEIYRDRAALDEHVTMPHYLYWSEKVKDWYAEPMKVFHCADVLLAEQAHQAR